MAQPSTSPSQRADASINDEKSALGLSPEVSIANLPSPDPDNPSVGVDVERAILLEPNKPAIPGPSLDKSTTSAAFWMAVNTLATIGIVQPPNSRCVTETDLETIGLHKQGPLFRPIVEVCAAHICRFPLLHNMAGSIRPVPPSNWHVYVEKGIHHTAHPSGHCHVPQRNPHKPLPCILDRHILSSRTNPSYPHGSIYELPSLQIHASQERRVRTGTGMYWRGHGLIL